MGRIRVLDDLLVSRIAAGEVVERPAAVVKELLENSVDAGASELEIAAVAGGKQLIRVRDDGIGMDRDDALLALERHATSKLSSCEDLGAIRTLGFRGEALPSIAAVSRFLMRTAACDGEGTEVEARAGRIVAVREVGPPRGTTIEVRNLFLNVPARRKFLRSEATELGYIVRVVTRYALALLGVRIRLTHGDRSVLEIPASRDLAERISVIYGPEFARKLLPVGLDRNGIKVRGLAGRPVDALPRRDAQQVFVNGRLVQDRILSHALAEAYGNTTARDRQPAVFLFLELDPGRVDVNVHPQKTEVRFARADEIHDALRDAVASALGHVTAVPSYTELRPGAYMEVAEPRPTRTAADPATGASLSAPPREEGRSDERRAVPLAQFRDSYVIAEDRDGLVLVDQHAAHERVLFERYLAQAEQNRVEVQRLLFPITVELDPHERLVLEEEAAEFARLGFLVEPFGGRSVRLDGVPSFAVTLEPTALLRTLLGEAARTRAAMTGIPELRRKLVTTAACQAAIKIHHPLTREAMQRLLDDLFGSANPTTCPHGRPTLFRLDLGEIERTFRRR